MKKCNFCGHSVLHEKRVQYLYKHNNHFLMVNDVPCEECEFCGERYYEAKTLKRIEREFHSIYNLDKNVKRQLSMPIEDFSELEAA